MEVQYAVSAKEGKRMGRWYYCEKCNGTSWGWTREPRYYPRTQAIGIFTRLTRTDFPATSYTLRLERSPVKGKKK